MSALTGAAIGAAVIAAALGFVVAAYRRHWTWTGFAGDSRKTLWDWLQLLVVPVALAAVAFGLSVWQDDRQRRQSAAVADRERTRAENRQQDEILGAYLRDMSGLLLRDDLVDSRRGSEVRRVARALTLTALRRVDAERKAALLRFLIESRLVQGPNVRVGITGADLRGVRLVGADLKRIDFTGSKMDQADLRYAYFAGTTLAGASLDEADFRFASLTGADFATASLNGADFRETYANTPDSAAGPTSELPRLSGAPDHRYDARRVHVGVPSIHERDKVLFTGAWLKRARFDGARLFGVSFASADLRDVSFRNVLAPRSDFFDANLRRADLSNAYLASALFQGTCVTETRFARANIRGALVEGMIGRRTDLTSARLDGVRGAEETLLPDLITVGTLDPPVLRELRATRSSVEETELIRRWGDNQRIAGCLTR